MWQTNKAQPPPTSDEKEFYNRAPFARHWAARDHCSEKERIFGASFFTIPVWCGGVPCSLFSFFLSGTNTQGYTEKRIQRDEPARQVLPKGVVPYHAEPESALSSAQVLNLNNNSNNQSNAHVAINSTPKATSRAYVDPHRT